MVVILVQPKHVAAIKIATLKMYIDGLYSFIKNSNNPIGTPQPKRSLRIADRIKLSHFILRISKNRIFVSLFHCGIKSDCLTRGMTWVCEFKRTVFSQILIVVKVHFQQALKKKKILLH